MNHREFYYRFTTEKACIIYLKQQLERGTVCCSKCGNNKLKWHTKNLFWRCKCMNRISVKSVTFMKDSNISLLKWFEAIFLFVNTKKPCSDLEFSRKIGIKRYKTVHYLLLKIRKQMSDDLSLLKFENIVSLAINDDYDCEMLVKKSEDRKNDKIKLQLPSSQTKVYSFLNGKNYHMKKIVLTNKIKTFKTPILKEVKQKWKNVLTENFNRIISGIHHFTTNFHTQLYLDEYAYKYNHRYSQNKFADFIDSCTNWQQSDHSREAL